MDRDLLVFRARNVVTFLAAAVSASLPTRALAQVEIAPEAPPTPDEAIVPPRAIEAPSPEYPAGETSVATVIVTLVVAQDGTVREVRSTDGPAPFAAIAAEAARNWRFEPATRGGKPTTAIVRVAIDFTPPAPDVPEPVSTPEEVPKSPDTNAPAQPEPVQEIVIRGTKPHPPSPANIGRADIRQLPGAMGDPLRSVEVLPGVTPTLSGLPYFYTRGAPPSTMAYYIDDLPLPYLFHAGLGPSILHPAFVRGVALEPAGGNPRYGRAVGAFVVATTNQPAERPTWEARLRAIDSSAFASAPFADGKAYAEVGSTVSYTGPLLHAFAPDYTIDYRDYAVRLTVDTSPRDRFTFFSLGSYDFVSQLEANNLQSILFAAELYRLDIAWDHSLVNGGDVRTGVTVGYDRSRLAGKRFASDQSVAARTRFRKRLTRQWDVEVGADARLDQYSADLPSAYSLTPVDYDETARVFATHADTVVGTAGSLNWRPVERLELMAGMRLDAYTSRDRTLPAVEPRTALTLTPTDRVRISTAHGLAHQTPSYAVPIPAVGIPGLPGGLQESLQSSITGEVVGPLDLTGAATVFRGVYSNLSDFVLLQSDFPLQRSPPLRGAANGIELSLRRPLRGAWGLMISYTLSHATREEDKKAPRLSSYDRTHVLNVATLFDLGKGFSAGLRVLMYAGLLRDPESGSVERLPAFYRLDARLGKRWKWGEKGYFGFILEALNATASRETVAIRCDDAGCRPRTIGPLTLPSFGIEGGM